MTGFSEALERASRSSQQTPSFPREINPRDARNVIPTFDPSDRKQNVNKWIAKINGLKELYRWGDTLTSAFMVERLRGLARDWYDGLDNIALSWNEWQTQLLAYFERSEELPNRLSEMLERTKRPNETMSTYFMEKLTLVSACNLKDKEAVECIAHGIKDDAIQAGIRAANFNNLEGLRIFLAKYDEKSRVSYPARNDQKHFDKGARLSRRDMKQNDRNRNERHNFNHRSESESSRSGPRYPNWSNQRSEGKTDEKNKSSEIICYKCNKAGHIARNCGTKKDIRSIGSSKPTSDTRFIEATINGVAAKAYVDLGAECVTLRKSDAIQMDITSHPTNDVLRGYGGAIIRPCGISKIMLKVDLVEAEVNSYIVPDEVQGISVIVGQPFTDLPGVVLI